VTEISTGNVHVSLIARAVLTPEEIPFWPWGVLLVALAYLAVPIDLVPDFLPGIGQLDDAVVLGLALRLIVRGGGRELVRGAWPGPQASLTVVLRAAGLDANGAASRSTTL
jgi:uncharacterized membrane protein YkvA (DUF1232 family)